MCQDLGSSPTTQECPKAADLLGCCPGNDVEQADAEQACIQADLSGTETWVQLPPEHVPAARKHIERHVVRLKKALHGHPHAGAYWEGKCDAHARSVGFEPIPDWPSSYYHPAWKMLLVIYVDDFKLAGPGNLLPLAWKRLGEGLVSSPPFPHTPHNLLITRRVVL